MEKQYFEKQIWYRCQACNYQRFGKNILDFEDMVLIKDCANCGGNWKFQCPQCGVVNKTRRVEKP